MRIGARVRLRSVLDTATRPEGVEGGEDYWRLIGCPGTVIDPGEGMPGFRGSPRVLVQFDRDPAVMGLHCHNGPPRALWIRMADLEV
ncbi:MAG: hypothetical protein AAFR52_08075, partial [Pseudomonadota bacterium]